jgi:hypothetical protein
VQTDPDIHINNNKKNTAMETNPIAYRKAEIDK